MKLFPQGCLTCRLTEEFHPKDLPKVRGVCPSPPSSGRGFRGKRDGKSENDNPKIRYSSHNVRRYISVNSHGIQSNVLLHFVPYSKDSFVHLQNQKLYAIRPVEEELKQKFDALTVNLSSPGKGIFRSVRDDLLEVISRCCDSLDVSEKASLLIRLGKILFHRKGSDINPNERINSQDLENALYQNRTSFNFICKTFETSIDREILEGIGRNAREDVQSEEQKERYYIRLEDRSNSEAVVYLVCGRSGEKSIVLKKVKLDPVRIFFADISCLRKSLDLRVALYCEKKITEFTDEEKICFDRIVTSASIEEEAIGGLHWPLGGDSLGRFKVVGSWHLTTTISNCGSWILKTQKANRCQYPSPSGRVTWESNIVNRELTELFMAQERDVGRIGSILENMLDWIWKLM